MWIWGWWSPRGDWVWGGVGLQAGARAGAQAQPQPQLAAPLSLRAVGQPPAAARLQMLQARQASMGAISRCHVHSAQQEGWPP